MIIRHMCLLHNTPLQHVFTPLHQHVLHRACYINTENHTSYVPLRDHYTPVHTMTSTPVTQHTMTSTRIHTITSTRVTQHANIIHTCHRRVVHHVFVPVRRHCEVNVVPVLGRSPESPSHQPIRCFPAATVLTMQTCRHRWHPTQPAPFHVYVWRQIGTSSS